MEKIIDDERMETSNLKIIGDFRIFKDIVLGSGQYGVVFLASKKMHKISIKEPLLAVKTLEKKNIKISSPEKFQAQIYSECKILSKLDHPNIVKLIDIRATANNYYLFLEYCSGGNLDKYRKKKNNREKTFSEAEALQTVKQIASAMLYCNKQSPPIIHRDLKPANILLHDGQIKISDFGFARVLESSNEKLRLTAEIGTPLYMAPEVYNAEDYDCRCDVWSLGIMLFEFLYGVPPWNSSKDIHDLFNNNILKKELVFPQKPMIKENTKDLIRKMLQKKLESRLNFEEVLNHAAFFEKKKTITESQINNLSQLSKSLTQNIELMNKYPLVENVYLNKKKTIEVEEEKNSPKVEVMSAFEDKNFKNDITKKDKDLLMAENYVGFYLNITRFLRKVVLDMQKNFVFFRSNKRNSFVFYLLCLNKLQLIILFKINRKLVKKKKNEFLTEEFYSCAKEKTELLQQIKENFEDSLKIYKQMIKEAHEYEKPEFINEVFDFQQNKELFFKVYKTEFRKLFEFLAEKYGKFPDDKKIVKLMVEIKICKSYEKIFEFFKFDKEYNNSDIFYEFYENLKDPEEFREFLMD